MKRGDVQIEVNEGMLTIRGEKMAEKEEKTGTARLIERSWGSFERRLSTASNGTSAFRMSGSR